MKRIAQSFLLSCLLIGVAQARTCNEIKSGVGNYTWNACDDPWIKTLESRLEKIANPPEKPPYSKKDISAWRDKAYSSCESLECLQNEYVRQISILAEKAVSAYEIRPDDIEATEQKSICDSIANLRESGEISNFEQAVIPYHFLEKIDGLDNWRLTKEETIKLGEKLINEEPVDIYKVKLSNNGRVARFGNFFTGGTCSSHNIYSIELLLDPSIKRHEDVTMSVDDPKDEIRWEYWGGGDVPYMISGRNLLVAGSLVSWINPRGKILPLCMIGSSATSRKWTVRKSEKLCNAADSAENILELFSPLNEINQNSLSQVEREEMRKHINIRETQTAVGRLDFDGDGRKEAILYKVTDSGAGCGSHKEAVKLLSVDEQQNRALAELLSELPSRNLKIIEVKGKYYISDLDSADRRAVYLIGNGKLTKVCESVPVLEYKVNRYFYPVISDEM